MFLRNLLVSLAVLAAVLLTAAVVAGGLVWTGKLDVEKLQARLLGREEAKKPDEHHDEEPHVHLSPQALNNLGVVIEPVRLRTDKDPYWRTISVPGVVTERPGQSDHIVTSRIAGVITRIHHVPGDTDQPGTDLFTLSLRS